MRETFRDIKLSRPNQVKLELINSIIQEYAEDGYVMTLRQLYYQLVSRDVIPNKQNEYAKISKLLKEGRMAGVVDWDAIEDRLRVPYLPYWVTGTVNAIDDTIRQYRLNRQKDQDTYIEVWVEKDALSGVLRRVTEKYHVNLLVNRGYGSVTAIHDVYERCKRYITAGKNTKILYLGDHDPSGMDMIRDIRERVSEMLLNGINWIDEFYQLGMDVQYPYLDMYSSLDEGDPDIIEFAAADWAKVKVAEVFQVDPIAITMEQIQRYTPPKNPAKLTDPRSKWYISKFGQSSWEVDALDPPTLNKLVSESIEENMDMSLYDAVLEQEVEDKNQLKELKEKL
tara:strand:- start:18553 stop:19569 length:1017 start_codon:yes stop_codon:yes gene_type:complete